MALLDIQRSFKESACGEIEVVSSGLNRFIVHVPFTFDDGDHFVVLLKEEGGSWFLSDEGHTFMHLSYDYTNLEFDQGTRRSIIDAVLSNFGIEDRAGELVLPIPTGKYGDALFSFAQAITRISDVNFLDRDRVRSTFKEDFHRLVEDKSREAGFESIQFDYTHPVQDPQKQYPVDVRINGKVTPQLLVFGIGNDTNCRDATIILQQWEKWEESFQSITVFRDQTEINRFVLARFTNVAGRLLSSLESAKDRLGSYFTQAIKSS
jgi:hypothetical protein